MYQCGCGYQSGFNGKSATRMHIHTHTQSNRTQPKSLNNFWKAILFMFNAKSTKAITG